MIIKGTSAWVRIVRIAQHYKKKWKNERQRFRRLTAWLVGWSISSYSRFIILHAKEIYRENNVRNPLFCTSTTMRFSISSQFKLLHFLFVSFSLSLSLCLSVSEYAKYILYVVSSSLAYERVATIILPLLWRTTAQTMYTTYNQKERKKKTSENSLDYQD